MVRLLPCTRSGILPNFPTSILPAQQSDRPRTASSWFPCMTRLLRQYTDHSRPRESYVFRVDEPMSGMRLDALLRERYPWKSRSHFQHMCRAGEILVGDKRAKASTRVRQGDRIEVRLPVIPGAPGEEHADDLVTLFEDDYLLAIDKPSGMSAHPVGTTRHGTLLGKLHALAKSRRSGTRDPSDDRIPRLGHRLDRDTSGVVLAVKDRAIDAVIGKMFANRKMHKRYVALVAGSPKADEGFIDAPMGTDPFAETTLHQAVRPQGLPAQTSWRVAERFSRHTLFDVEPHTGRTHQIRVHLAHSGWPIVADHLYGDLRPLYTSMAAPVSTRADDRPLLSRLALHASELAFRHPVTGADMVIQSDLPQDIRSALHALRTIHGLRR